MLNTMLNFPFDLNNNCVSTEFSCEYLRIKVDQHLSYKCHVAYVVQ